MTSDLWLDSCVLAKLVLSESDSSVVQKLVQSEIDQSRAIRVLDLALIEVGNVIWKTWRRKLIETKQADVAFNDLMAMRVTVEAALPFLTRGQQLARKYEIAVYDAVFVAAVEEGDCRGVTSDEALVKKVRADFPQIERLNSSALPNA
ncbi:MAG: type II toxin-antitoxin system VapC family toxin [Planctomycetaceae bacterium]|nr:type II toxin-antitoxin system VapC family toxin [Planctomycetaceae bacterium]